MERTPAKRGLPPDSPFPEPKKQRESIWSTSFTPVLNILEYFAALKVKSKPAEVGSGGVQAKRSPKEKKRVKQDDGTELEVSGSHYCKHCGESATTVGIFVFDMTRPRGFREQWDKAEAHMKKHHHQIYEDTLKRLQTEKLLEEEEQASRVMSNKITNSVPGIQTNCIKIGGDHCSNERPSSIPSGQIHRGSATYSVRSVHQSRWYFDTYSQTLHFDVTLRFDITHTLSPLRHHTLHFDITHSLYFDITHSLHFDITLSISTSHTLSTLTYFSPTHSLSTSTSHTLSISAPHTPLRHHTHSLHFDITLSPFQHHTLSPFRHHTLSPFRHHTLSLLRHHTHSISAPHTPF